MSFNRKLATSLGLSNKEVRVLKQADTPAKIQDLVNSLSANFEVGGETIRSPRRSLRDKTAHCLEGALVASLALWLHGFKPLLVDLKVDWNDDEHVIAIFKVNGYWGAISKTNHAVLRYRDPIYRSVRELVMTYFHEYTTEKGLKALRSYTKPISLVQLAKTKKWVTSEEDLWWLPPYLDRKKHYSLLPKKYKSSALRPSDKIERLLDDILEWPRPNA